LCPEAQENEVGIEAEIIRARGEAQPKQEQGEPVATEKQIHECIAYVKGGCDIEQTAKNIELKLKELNYA